MVIHQARKLQQEYNKFLIKHNRITFDTKATRTNQIKRYDKIRHLIKPEKLAIFEQELQKMQDELDIIKENKNNNQFGTSSNQFSKMGFFTFVLLLIKHDKKYGKSIFVFRRKAN